MGKADCWQHVDVIFYMLDWTFLLRSLRVWQVTLATIEDIDGRCSGHEWPHKQWLHGGLQVFILRTSFWLQYLYKWNVSS